MIPTLLKQRNDRPTPARHLPAWFKAKAAPQPGNALKKHLNGERCASALPLHSLVQLDSVYSSQNSSFEQGGDRPGSSLPTARANWQLPLATIEQSTNLTSTERLLKLVRRISREESLTCGTNGYSLSFVLRHKRRHSPAKAFLEHEPVSCSRGQSFFVADLILKAIEEGQSITVLAF